MPVQQSNYGTRQEWKQLINNVTVYTVLQIYWPGVTSGSVHLDLTTQESDAAEKGLEDLSVARTRCLEGGGIMRAWRQNWERRGPTYWSCFCSPQVIGSLLESASGSGLALQTCSCRQGDSDSIPRPSPGHVTPSPPPNQHQWTTTICQFGFSFRFSQWNPIKFCTVLTPLLYSTHCCVIKYSL